MDPRQNRITQDNDGFPSGDSYSKLFNLIKAKQAQWAPFARRPLDILTVHTPGSTSSLLKRANDLNHNGFPYQGVRPFAGIMGPGERPVVINDPQGPYALGVLSNDTPANTATIGSGPNVSGVTANGYTGVRGSVQFTTGTAPAAGEALLTVTFAVALAYLPVVFVQDQAGSRQYGCTNVTVNGFTITAGPSGLPGSSTFTVGYLAVL